MHEIDKQSFGAFLAQLRKEKGYTQKELAERLYVSDKAISKWERGLSMPDVSLLIPLAEALEVTVTELLEGKRAENPQPKSPEAVEQLLKKTLSLKEEKTVMDMKRRRNIWIFAAGLAVVALEWLVMGQIPYLELNVLEGLSIGFGFYFWLLAKETLPGYYDENPISSYSHGPLRMNLPGVKFNNRNWPHIVKALRIWTMVTMVSVPLAATLLEWRVLRMAVYTAYLAALVIPLYRVGKKYE